VREVRCAAPRPTPQRAKSGRGGIGGPGRAATKGVARSRARGPCAMLPFGSCAPPPAPTPSPIAVLPFGAPASAAPCHSAPRHSATGAGPAVVDLRILEAGRRGPVRKREGGSQSDRCCSPVGAPPVDRDAASSAARSMRPGAPPPQSPTPLRCSRCWRGRGESAGPWRPRARRWWCGAQAGQGSARTACRVRDWCPRCFSPGVPPLTLRLKGVLLPGTSKACQPPAAGKQWRPHC
jgi:hypothetical protein